MKRKLNSLVAFAVLLFVLPSCSNAQKEVKSNIKAQNVSVTEFKKMVDMNPTGQIIDVRTPEEHAQGYVEGATLMNINSSDFASKIETLDKKAPVYVYCRSGGRSGNAMNIMKEMGFEEVYNLSGGMMAWEQAKYPVKK